MEKKKEHPLVAIILDVLQAEGRDLGEFSPMVQVGIARMILAHRDNSIGVEQEDGFPIPFITYLEDAEIPYTQSIITKVNDIIEKYELIKDGRVNQSNEDLEHPVTWGLWANLFDEMLEVTYQNGERMYRNNAKGMEYVEDLLKNKS